VNRVHRRGLHPSPELLQQRVVLSGEETLPVVEEDVRPECPQRRLDDPQAEQAGSAWLKIRDIVQLIGRNQRSKSFAYEYCVVVGRPVACSSFKNAVTGLTTAPSASCSW
jgi:hypothetical protein